LYERGHSTLLHNSLLKFSGNELLFRMGTTQNNTPGTTHPGSQDPAIFEKAIPGTMHTSYFSYHSMGKAAWGVEEGVGLN
jgi:hypothetical protein